MIVLDDRVAGQDVNAEARYGGTFCYCLTHENKVGTLLGGVTFSSYTGEHGSVMVHAAGFAPGWCSRDMLWATFDYAFNHLKCKVALAVINSKNKKALAFNKRVGFTVKAIIEDVYPDGDMLILVMPIERCRWLGPQPKGFKFRKA
jgi:RimJ/RimL family protein N-acetyltransferase